MSPYAGGVSDEIAHACSPTAAALLSFAAAAVPAAPALAAAESQDPIKITLNDWTGQFITSKIMGEVLKKAGYNVEYVQADYLAQFAGLKTGDLTLAMEIWATTGQEALDDGVASGKVENLGETGMLAKEEWWFPEYMKEKCPGLPDWTALKEPACAEAFSIPETAPNGRYLERPGDLGRLRRGTGRGARPAVRGRPRRHRRGALRRTRERLSASGADHAVDLFAALGAGQIQGRVGRVPGIRAGLLHRSVLGHQSRPRL